MDIKVTKLEPVYVKEVDRKVAELGRNFSRNEYFKMLIQNDCELRLTQIKEDNFDRAIKKLNYTLTNQSEKLQEFIDGNNCLFHLIRSGVDILESEWEEER